jgi:hypothetical protein
MFHVERVSRMTRALRLPSVRTINQPKPTPDSDRSSMTTIEAPAELAFRVHAIRYSVSPGVERRTGLRPCQRVPRLQRE